MKIKDIAHLRAGDKGNLINISVVTYDEDQYQIVNKLLTEDYLQSYFADFHPTTVEKYCLPQLNALNFVFKNFLDGGVTRNLRVDRHGKSMSSALGEIILK